MIDVSMEKILQYEYCEYLLGNRKSLSKYYFGKKDKHGADNTLACERNAIIVLKFVFEKILFWTPQEAEEKLTPKIVKTFKLEPFIKMLRWPTEFNPRVDLYYVVWKTYPSYPHIDANSVVVSIYKKILNNERSYFPKEFFIGAEGRERLKICITYYARQKLSFSSEKEIYEYFVDTKKADDFLSKAKLKKYVYMIFGSPLNAIQSIIEDKKNHLIYLVYLFSYLDTQRLLSKNKEKLKNRNNNKFINAKPINKDDYCSLF